MVALAFIIFPCFSYALLISRIFPFPGIGRIYGDQKLLATLMSLSKLPVYFDEAIKNFLHSLMSHQALTARHIQFQFSLWTSPVSFSPARRASKLPLRSGLARGLSRDPSRVTWCYRSRQRGWGILPPPLDTLAGLSQVHNAMVMALHSTECSCCGRLPGMPT